MGCSIGVVGTAEFISGDDEVGFGGEMGLTNEEDVDMVKI